MGWGGCVEAAGGGGLIEDSERQRKQSKKDVERGKRVTKPTPGHVASTDTTTTPATLT